MTRFTKAVRAELRARHLARDSAEMALVSYIRGALDQLGIELTSYVGFDDETGEILLKVAEVAAQPPIDSETDQPAASRSAAE